jgi:hypothetical protein
MHWSPWVVLLAVLSVAVPAEAWAQAKDRHAGYYYPTPKTHEIYRARIRVAPEASRNARIAFVTNITNGMIAKNAYPPPFVMFVKGNRKEKLIIVGLRDNAYNTLFRARALLAQLTSISRTTRLFREHSKADCLTFLDLLKLMGFELLTVSDGKDFAHQIMLR